MMEKARKSYSIGTPSSISLFKGLIFRDIGRLAGYMSTILVPQYQTLT